MTLSTKLSTASLTKLALLLVALGAASGCRGRDRRPITVQAPPKTGAAAAGQQSVNPAATAGATGHDTLQNTSNGNAQGRPNDTTSDASIVPPVVSPKPDAAAGGATPPAATGGATPAPTGGATPGGGSAQPTPSTVAMTIATTLDDGTKTTMQWDGKSFKGNDQWDVVFSQ